MLTNPVRYFGRNDVKAVTAIDRACCIDSNTVDPWPEQEFKACLSSPTRTMLVYARNDRVVGFLVFERHDTCINILRLGVDPAFRRQKVASSLLERAKYTIVRKQLNRLEMLVPEECLGMQLFLRTQEVRCTSIMRNDDGAVYYFEWEPAKAAQATEAEEVNSA